MVRERIKKDIRRFEAFCSLALRTGHKYGWVDLAALYRLTTDDNGLRKGWHMPPKTTGVVTQL
jgi:hypothetical protein